MLRASQHHSFLCHVPKPEAALAEALRVLRLAGSVVVFDGDYATTTFAAGNFDPPAMLCGCGDGRTGSSLADTRASDDAPLRPVRGAAMSQLWLHGASRTELHVHISRPRGRFAARRRTDRAGMAEALKAEARRRAEVNHFYGLIVFASAVARKPTSTGTRS